MTLLQDLQPRLSKNLKARTVLRERALVRLQVEKPVDSEQALVTQLDALIVLAEMITKEVCRDSRSDIRESFEP